MIIILWWIYILWAYEYKDNNSTWIFYTYWQCMYHSSLHGGGFCHFSSNSSNDSLFHYELQHFEGNIFIYDTVIIEPFGIDLMMVASPQFLRCTVKICGCILYVPLRSNCYCLLYLKVPIFLFTSINHANCQCTRINIQIMHQRNSSK